MSTAAITVFWAYIKCVISTFLMFLLSLFTLWPLWASESLKQSLLGVVQLLFSTQKTESTSSFDKF